MKRALLTLTCLPLLAAAAAAQTSSTTTIQASSATAVSTTTATAPISQTQPTIVQPSTAAAPGAWRPGRGPWHRDCDADVQRLCPGVTTREQVEECLHRDENRLSPACQNIRKKEGHRR